MYTVVANFASTTDYTSAISTTTFHVTRATPTVTVTDSGGTFTGSSFAAGASVSGVSSPTPAASLEGSAAHLHLLLRVQHQRHQSWGGGTHQRGHLHSSGPLCRLDGLRQRHLDDDLQHHQGDADPDRDRRRYLQRLGVPSRRLDFGAGNPTPAASLEGTTPTFTYYSGSTSGGTSLEGTHQRRRLHGGGQLCQHHGLQHAPPQRRPSTSPRPRPR